MTKAFIVTAPDSENSAIIFADQNITARKWGAHEWNDGDLRGMICQRVPGFDCYAATGVPASEMVELGWWFECYNCCRHIESQNFDDLEMPISAIVGTQHSAVYCNADCHDQRADRKAREDQAGDAFLTMMRSRVTARFGNVDFVTGAFKEHMFAQETDGHVMIRDACVSFNFPGQTIAPASLHYQPKYIIGPVKLEVRCCAGDSAAFESFASALQT